LPKIAGLELPAWLSGKAAFEIGPIPAGSVNLLANLNPLSESADPAAGSRMTAGAGVCHPQARLSSALRGAKRRWAKRVAT